MSGAVAARAAHRLSSGALVARYAAFAAIATVANLGAQRAALAAVPEPFAFPAALVLGTGIGLVVKYLLDRRWIFAVAPAPARAEARRFTLYGLTGVATTLLFWAVETGFWLAWRTDAARELGAVIGLAIGYTIKYRLDRRFVFAAGDDP